MTVPVRAVPRRAKLQITVGRATSKAKFAEQALASLGAQVGFGQFPESEVPPALRKTKGYQRGVAWARSK